MIHTQHRAVAGRARDADVGVEKSEKILDNVHTEELWRKRNRLGRYLSVWWTTEKRPWELYLCSFFNFPEGKWRANGVNIWIGAEENSLFFVRRPVGVVGLRKTQKDFNLHFFSSLENKRQFI